MIKGEEKNRGCWSIGIVKELIKGTDGVVRAARLKAKKSVLERAMQRLYPFRVALWQRDGGEDSRHRKESFKMTLFSVVSSHYMFPSS